MDLSSKLKTAAEAAVTTGEMLRQTNKGQFIIEQKAANDFVTEIDRQAEEMIISRIQKDFPFDSFMGEEGGDSIQGKSGGRWIIDPIDGTTNFIHHIPNYAISIAYEEKGELVGGVVYNPSLDELFVAAKGMGAFRNGEPIHVSSMSYPQKAVVGVAFSHRNHQLAVSYFHFIQNVFMEINDIRRMGSAALDLCNVACGRTEAFLELNLHLYDIAAGVVILKEAGGMVSGWAPNEDCLVTGNTLATNGHLHAWFQEQIQKNFR